MTLYNPGFRSDAWKVPRIVTGVAPEVHFSVTIRCLGYVECLLDT